MKNILITGGCGFIGSNLVLHLARKYPTYKLVNLDLMTYASDESYRQQGIKEITVLPTMQKGN